MASLKELVAKHGLPCPVRCTNDRVEPFVVLSNGSRIISPVYNCFNEKRRFFTVAKECKYTNDYEFDNSKLYGDSKVYELFECLQKTIELASNLNLMEEHEQLIKIRNKLKILYGK